ncbi:MAG TPA: hypothetical protein DCY27_10030 [Desulfobacterales bacterium]|nr:hypothetical protein [Desulfobacterales bacterium]
MRLISLGLNPGPADGVFGAKTEAAVKEFQRLHGLTVDGIAGQQTERKIYEVFNGAPIKPQPLAGRTFIIEAGHGGSDPGAVDGLSDDPIYTEEKAMVLLYMKDFAVALETLGAKVVRIRLTDADLELADRTDIANRYPDAAVIISWHANSAEDKTVTGEETLIYSNESQAKKLAEAIRSEVQKAGVALHGGGIVERPGLWVLRKTKMPAVIIEIGFISNPAEEKKLHDPAYRRKLIDAVVKATVTVYGQAQAPPPYYKTRYAGSDVHVVQVQDPVIYIAQMEPGTAKVSDMANWNKAKVAINGGYFYAGDGVVAVTPVIQNHISVGLQETQTCPRAAFCFADDGRMEIRQATSADELSGYKHALGGGPMLVQGGVVRVANEGFLPDITQGRAPRTAVGLVDERTVLFVVAEGRSLEDAGLTLEQMAAFMVSRGCRSAMNLDGGGSSAMWVEGRGIINQMSDGRERSVKNALMIL